MKLFENIAYLIFTNSYFSFAVVAFSVFSSVLFIIWTVQEIQKHKVIQKENENLLRLASSIAPKTPASMYYTLCILEEMRKRGELGFVTNYQSEGCQLTDEEVQLLKACRHKSSYGEPYFVDFQHVYDEMGEGHEIVPRDNEVQE